MAQFRLNWDSTEVAANPNDQNQIASYRRKSTGGSWITAGFTPTNPLAENAVTALTPNSLLANVVYELRVEANCEENGPQANDNGIQEQIVFNCIIPDITNGDDTSTIVVDLTGNDITKVRFVLRKSSDNSVAYGPVTANRLSNAAQAIAIGLTPSTNYYWQTIFYANINGVEVLSSNPEYLNTVCGPYLISTEALPAPDYHWTALTSVCEKEGGLSLVKSITGLSTPLKTWYDIVNNLVYVVDLDAPDGNIYWFNPSTALTEADVTYSSVWSFNTLFATYIDSVNRKIYAVGGDTSGMLVYDIDTDTTSTVAYGTNAAFSRSVLVVEGNNIYVNDANTSIVTINRTTLTVTTTKLISTIPTPAYFTGGPYALTIIGSEIWVTPQNNPNNKIAVYNLALTSLIAQITLPGVAFYVGSNYFMNPFYDPTNNKFYVSDNGSSKVFVINSLTKAISLTRNYLNREGKAFTSIVWSLNPVTNELYNIYTGLNSGADVSPIYRIYAEDRVSNSFLNMFEGDNYTDLMPIDGTNNVMGVVGGLYELLGTPGWDTDGSIKVISTSGGSGNTGRKIVVTLQEVDANNGNTPSGNTKPNVISDPDYIAPTTDTGICPITNTLTCPTDLVTTLTGATLYYEFAILSSVRDNPNIAKMEIYAYNTDTASVEGLPVVVSSPALLYYAGTFTGLGGTNYTIQIRYLDNTDTILQTC